MDWKIIIHNTKEFVRLIKTFLKFQVLLTPPDEGPRVKGLRIKLQDIVDGEYTPLRVNGTWIGGKINLFDETYIKLFGIYNICYIEFQLTNSYTKIIGAELVY